MTQPREGRVSSSLWVARPERYRVRQWCRCRSGGRSQQYAPKSGEWRRSVEDVSVDVGATISKSFPLWDLAAATGEVFGELAGTHAPEAVAAVGRRYEQGVEVEPGSLVAPDSPVCVGDFATLSDPDRSVQHFELELRGHPDRVLALVVDHEELGWGGNGVTVDFSPHRTPVGVLLAVAAALASATVGSGEFVDLNIRFVDPPLSDPRTFIQRCRLERGDQPLASSALAWVRQFEHLGGWPPAG